MEFNTKEAIFVFGSNEGGFHGAGAAKFALEHRGAILRVGVGPQGRSYAIPTKDASIKNTLPLEQIQYHVERFLQHARNTQAFSHYQVTRIGCGLAGLKDEQIAPMFKDASPNCWFDEAWKPWLPDAKFWGTF